MAKILGGKHQGGYGQGLGGKKSSSGIQGGGTLKFGWTGGAHDTKETMGGERQAMPNGYKGRVLYSSKNKRIGRQEGTGPQS